LRDWLASVEPEPADIHLVGPENQLRSRKVQLLSGFLIERIGTPPYWEF
jgi:hypothetical protein